VAYLRIIAHTEEKSPLSEPWPSFPQPLLENKFGEIYRKTKHTPRFQPSEGDTLDYVVPDSPRLVQIGPGVYVTDTISTPMPSSIEADTRYCLDTLTSTPFQVFNIRCTSCSRLINRTRHLNDPLTERHVRFHNDKPSICNLLHHPPPSIPRHHLNNPPTPSTNLSFRNSEHLSTQRSPRPVSQLLGSSKYRAVFSINLGIKHESIRLTLVR
jgi:hypothetical protein